jgi:hypothetical protein
MAALESVSATRDFVRCPRGAARWKVSIEPTPPSTGCGLRTFGTTIDAIASTVNVSLVTL